MYLSGGDVENGGRLHMCGGRNIQDISVPSLQRCCKPYTTLNKKNPITGFDFYTA